MTKEVYVITSPENGWDCLIAVVSNVTEELEQLCEQNDWCILSSYSGIMTADKFVKDHDE